MLNITEGEVDINDVRRTPKEFNLNSPGCNSGNKRKLKTHQAPTGRNILKTGAARRTQKKNEPSKKKSIVAYAHPC